MDERLSRSNRLPGSEKLTRPEEIGQLSKYLKSIKKDESIRLEDQVLGVVGISTGKIPKIDKLPTGSVKLGGIKRVNLDGRVVKVPKDEETKDTKLEGKRLSIPDLKEYIELSKKRIEAPGDVDRVEELKDKVLKLQDTRETVLSEKKIGPKGTENEVALSQKRLDLQDIIDASLSKKRVDLKDDREVELDDKKVELKDDREINLGDKKIRLTDERDPELPEKKIKLYDEREVKLEDKRLDIQDAGEVRLENKRINLSADTKDIKLEDKLIGLTDERDPELSDKRIGLIDDREVELSEKRLDLEDDREVGLGEKRLDLTDERENQLGNKRLDLTDDREVGLEEKRLDLKDGRDTELSEKRLNLEDDREVNLSDKILEIFDDREVELGDKRLDLTDKREVGLSEKRLNLEDNREVDLEDKRLNLKDEREIGLSDKVLDKPENENGEPTELYDQFLGLPENENGEPTELYDQYIGLTENENQDPESLSDKLIKLLENQGDAPDISKVETIKQYTSGLSDAELYDTAMKIASEGEDGSGDTDGWLQKVEGLMSTYLSSDILTPKRAIEFRDAINNSLEASYFGSQAALRVPVDTSSGTTWAKAEEAIGTELTGTNRRDALDEMIVKLVDYRRDNLPRLPGSDLIDAAKGVVKNVTGMITGDSSHDNPMNKPIHMDGHALPGGYGDTLYQAVNNRTTYDTLDPVGDTIGTIFYDRYWSSKSFKTTLEDLCPILGKAPVASLAELKAMLKASPYITTPGKFMTDTKGSYNTQTLDTNMYWEIVIEPFCMKDGNCSNGGFSYLPSIQEINFENEFYHKVRTRYGFWAPINGFELQKSKLVTKSLSLYEGEIVYPTGMEFTNELRLTFVDDSWKSWRRYFEKCAKVAVFNSNPHSEAFYQIPKFSSDAELTKIDKSNICIAPYKNLAFNIRIYVLSPQLNTLKKYNLLCVLKDFAEEYVGEVDSGGTDLNVSFSIVGENPMENSATNYALLTTEIIASSAQQVALETQKRITNAINSSVGLL